MYTGDIRRRNSNTEEEEVLDDQRQEEIIAEIKSEFINQKKQQRQVILALIYLLSAGIVMIGVFTGAYAACFVQILPFCLFFGAYMKKSAVIWVLCLVSEVVGIVFGYVHRTDLPKGVYIAIHIGFALLSLFRIVEYRFNKEMPARIQRLEGMKFSYGTA